jgi:hypothetical protein
MHETRGKLLVWLDLNLHLRKAAAVLVLGRVQAIV